MEANCFIFPSPNKYNLSSIKKKIILISQNPKENQHMCYSSHYCGQNMFENDQFSQFLEELKQRTNNKQKISLRKSTCMTEDEKCLEIQNKLEGNLNINEKVNSKEYIPCLFIKGTKKKLILFFHANGEDLATAYQFLRLVAADTKYSILAMEYRGYSLYQGQTNSANIEADAARVVEFLQANKFATNQLILFGRSIGCAVGLTVAQKYSIHCSILLSPFISLKKIANDLYGGCASMMLKQAFNNEQNCKQILSPILIIHGKMDTLVPFQHSLALMSGCKAYCRLKIIDNMTHTKFNFRLDFIRHFSKFLQDLE